MSVRKGGFGEMWTSFFLT